MIPAQRLAQGLLAVCAVLSLVACFPPKPTRDEIIGRWVEQRSRSRVEDDGACAYFDFAEDGRFKAHNILTDYFMWERFRPPEFPSRVDAEGTWKLDTSSQDPFALHQVLLEFGPIPGLVSGFTAQLSITYPSPRWLLAGAPDTPLHAFRKREDIDCK